MSMSGNLDQTHTHQWSSLTMIRIVYLGISSSRKYYILLIEYFYLTYYTFSINIRIILIYYVGSFFWCRMTHQSTFLLLFRFNIYTFISFNHRSNFQSLTVYIVHTIYILFICMFRLLSSLMVPILSGYYLPFDLTRKRHVYIYLFLKSEITISDSHEHASISIHQYTHIQTENWFFQCPSKRNYIYIHCDSAQFSFILTIF